MRILILALLLTVAAIILWTTAFAPGLVLPQEVELAARAAVAVLALWALVEGVLAIRAGGTQAVKLIEAENKTKDLEARLTEVTNEARSVSRERDRLREELDALRTEANEMRTALTDAQARLERQRHEAASKSQPAEREILSLLSLLQTKGRFIDFLMDDVAKYGDAQVGAAARVVHQGCSAVVKEYFQIEPVAESPEGTDLTLGPEFDAHEFRLLGKVGGEPPYKGRLLHRGWRAKGIRLPRATGDSGAGKDIIAPAEVEIRG